MTGRLCALAMACALVCSCDEMGAPLSDAGPVDGGAPAPLPLDPIAMEFEPLSFPTTTLRLALAAAGDAVFTTTPAGLERSTDRGASWQVFSTTATLAHAGDSAGRLIALTQTGLVIWPDPTDSGTSTTAALPAELGAPGRLFVSADDAIWVLSQASPYTLVRSVDAGASWTPVAMPAASSLLACAPLGDALAFVVDGTSLVRVSADGPTALGDVPVATACATTGAGTVLVSANDGAPIELVFTDNVTAPERREPTQSYRYSGVGARVVRWGVEGALMESLDHGATFSARAATVPVTPFVLDGVALVPGALVALTSQAPASLADDADAWVIHPQPGLPINLAVHDLSFAASSNAIGMLLDDNLQRTLYVTRDGVTWRRGLTFPVAAAHCMALDPTGERVIVAGAYGGFTILGDSGRTVLHAGQIASAAGLVETDTVRQCVWGPDPAGSVILVSVADDQDTRGRLWQLDGESDAYTWLTLTPTETFQSPAIRDGGYHALSVSRAGQFEDHAPEDRSLAVSFRSFVTTGTWTTQLFTQFSLFDADSSWDEAAPPVLDSAALSASHQAQTSRGVAFLWPNNRLYFGKDMRFLRAVPLPAGLAPARVARFAPDGHLWMSAGGVWRSTRPFNVDE